MSERRSAAPPHQGPREDPAMLAARYGLTAMGVRPRLFAYVRELWQRRHFILAFSQAKLTAQYSRARLGQLWQLATPLLNALVFYLVFAVILQVDRGMERQVYIPFLVTGVFVFAFTQASVMAGLRSISGNLGLVRALHFPRASLPIAFCFQQLQQLLCAMAVLVLVAVGFGSYPTWSWLLVVPALAAQFAFNCGLALLGARLGSHTPDLVQLMPFCLRVWMYASGVMFSLPMVLAGRPDWLLHILQWNPAALYMDLVRSALIKDYGAAYLAPQAWPVAVGWAVAALALGFGYFYRAEERYGRG